ncbi:MAG: hypothetical protein ABI183_26165 [Polyangiaceae bacterium]
MKAIRLIFATAVIFPFLLAVGCDLRKPDTTDGGASVSVTAPATTDTAAPTTNTAEAATVVAPIATVAPAGAKPTGKTAKLPNGQTGAVVTLTDGGTAVVPQSADGGIPGLGGFVMPPLPTNIAIPSSIPRTLPSGFPTTLPSGFTMPTFPPAPAASH